MSQVTRLEQSMSLKQHGGRVAVQHSKQIRTTKATAEAQQRLADKSFTRFMREHNAKRGQ